MTFAELQFIGWTITAILIFVWMYATYTMMDG